MSAHLHVLPRRFVLGLLAACALLISAHLPVAPVPIAGAASAPAAWMRTTRETGMWSGPDGAAKEFAKIAKGMVIQAIETKGGRTFAYFGGDGKTQRPGEIWVENQSLEPAAWPRWLRARRAGKLLLGQLGETGALDLPRGAWVETTNADHGPLARAFYLGDGRTTDPVEGWVMATDLWLPPIPQEQIAAAAMDRRTLAAGKPDIWLKVPYRSQLDGSPYAEANCGPTSVAMALEAFGITHPPGMLREAVLSLQEMPDCDDCGVFIQHMAAVAEARGVPTYGLRGEDEKFRQWSLDDVRQALRAGRVVIPEVKYRLLPGRGRSLYWGDHYVVVTGIQGDKFIYNDPIDHDGSGYGRVISAPALAKAMEESNYPGAAFAIGR